MKKLSLFLFVLSMSMTLISCSSISKVASNTKDSFVQTLGLNDEKPDSVKDTPSKYQYGSITIYNKK